MSNRDRERVKNLISEIDGNSIRHSCVDIPCDTIGLLHCYLFKTNKIAVRKGKTEMP